MSPSVFGCRSARRRIVGAVFGVSAVDAKRRSVSIAGADDVVVRERRAVAERGEEIAREQRARRLLVQHHGVPAVRYVRRSQEAYPFAADVENLAVFERARRARRLISERDHAADLALHRRGVRCVR